MSDVIRGHRAESALDESGPTEKIVEELLKQILPLYTSGESDARAAALEFVEPYEIEL